MESIAVGGELQPTLDGPVLILEVTDEGRVSGSTGINRFQGGLGDDGVFAHLATTGKSGAHELIAQEAIYLKHLETADGFEVDIDGEGICLLARGLIVVTLQSLGAKTHG